MGESGEGVYGDFGDFWEAEVWVGSAVKDEREYTVV
jgi:hypothetical protein